MSGLPQCPAHFDLSVQASRAEARAARGCFSSPSWPGRGVRMATGGGKSLCTFLVPLAARADAVGVVISPLNVLIDEQV